MRILSGVIFLTLVLTGCGGASDELEVDLGSETPVGEGATENTGDSAQGNMDNDAENSDTGEQEGSGDNTDGTDSGESMDEATDGNENGSTEGSGDSQEQGLTDDGSDNGTQDNGTRDDETTGTGESTDSPTNGNENGSTDGSGDEETTDDTDVQEEDASGNDPDDVASCESPIEENPIGDDPIAEDPASGGEEESGDDPVSLPIENADLATLPGQAVIDLGRFTCPNPPEGESSTGSMCSNSNTDYSGLVYDHTRGGMLMFGGGHAATMTDDVYRFSFETLEWSSSYQPTACADMTPENYDVTTASWTTTGYPISRHTYDMLAVSNSGDFILLGNGGTSGGANCAGFVTNSPAGIAYFNPDDNSWLLSDFQIPWSKYASSEVDPTTGWIFVVNDHYFYVFDPENMEYLGRFNHGLGGVSYSKNMVYYPPNDKMYYIQTATTIYEITLDRTDLGNTSFVLLDDIQGDIPSLKETGFAYDSNSQLIGGGIRDGYFYTFAPETQTWSRNSMTLAGMGVAPSTVDFHAIDYDPVNNVFLFMGENHHTYLYRHTVAESSSGASKGSIETILAAPADLGEDNDSSCDPINEEEQPSGEEESETETSGGAEEETSETETGEEETGSGNSEESTPVGEIFTQVTISGDDQADVPVTFGHVFKVGDVPEGSTVEALNATDESIPIQVDAKTYHADGSLRHAIISTVLTELSSQEDTVMRLRATNSTNSSAAIALSELQETSFDTVISVTTGGTTYSASASSLLETLTPATWLQGQIATEWQVAHPLTTSGGSEHPHLTARFNIRAYQGLESVRVSVILENNWSYVDAPSNQQYDLNVTVGNQTVLSQTDVEHYHHARWRRTFWWSPSSINQSPDTHVSHNKQYLLDSKAIPHYDPTLEVAQQAIDGLAQRLVGHEDDLMGIGLARPDMPGTGGADDIGPLPRWTALYLLSMDETAKANELTTGEQAGAWPIHYRDKNTTLPISLDDYPYMTLKGLVGDTYNSQTGEYEAFPNCNNCSTPLAPDAAHQPSLAFIPYLVTGDHYFLEELHFWSNWNMLRANPYYRDFSDGVTKRDQTRAQAWTVRTLAQAAYITPDTHPLKSYFTEKLDHNRYFYEEHYVNGNSQESKLPTNNLGWIAPVIYGERISPWMDDFFTWATGYVVDLGFENWRPVAEWKSAFPVGRMTAPGYCWIYGAVYQASVSETAGGTLFTSFSDMYETTLVNLREQPEVLETECASQEMADLLGLSTGEMIGYSASATGYPSNMQPALSVAVDLGVESADHAWQLFENNAVKPTATTSYAYRPQYAIVPRQ